MGLGLRNPTGLPVGVASEEAVKTMIAVNFDKREYLNIDESKKPFYINEHGITSLEQLIYLIN